MFKLAAVIRSHFVTISCIEEKASSSKRLLPREALGRLSLSKFPERWNLLAMPSQNLVHAKSNILSRARSLPW
jgi:hypothetical protein